MQLHSWQLNQQRFRAVLMLLNYHPKLWQTYFLLFLHSELQKWVLFSRNSFKIWKGGGSIAWTIQNVLDRVQNGTHFVKIAGVHSQTSTRKEMGEYCVEPKSSKCVTWPLIRKTLSTAVVPCCATPFKRWNVGHDGKTHKTNRRFPGHSGIRTVLEYPKNG